MTGQVTDADREPEAPAPEGEPANIAPDAVKDPNEKTEGMPGAGPAGATQNDEADTGGA